MEEFKRKLIILECIVLLLVGGISFKLINKPKELEKPKEEKKETLAMYLEDESGSFQISNSKTFPKECYILERAECENGGTVTQNPDTKSISANFSKADKCNLYFRKNIELITLSNGLKVNPICVSEYSKGEQSEMYTFEHDETTQTTGWTQEERRDYRYIGVNPNNWLKFNEEDWRIIGVFTVETASGKKEQLIKLIRNESIGYIPWDDYTDRNHINEWSRSSLNTLLNGDYYNTASSFSYTYKGSNSLTGGTITIPKGLNDTARSQIEEVKWYLGGSDKEIYYEGSGYYNFERGTITCATTGKCSGETRSTSTIDKVGLMYPSDYVYTFANGVDDMCFTNPYSCGTSQGGTPTNSWLHYGIQWTISPYANHSAQVFGIYNGKVLYYQNTNEKSEVRPVVYLKSDIKIISGDGASSETAYQLN